MSENKINYETGEIVPPSTDPKALAGLFAKLARVMGKLERLQKRGHNDHFNYDFVLDADVLDEIRIGLAAENVAFFASMPHVEYVNLDGKKTKAIAHLIFTYADGETGATWSCPWVSEAIDMQDKGTAKAATLGLKYHLLKNFVLSTGDPLDDPDADTPAPAKAQPKRQAKAKNGNGTEKMKADFFARVLSEIPYYEHVNHVANALKAAGFTAYAQSKEKEMFAALEKNANEEANKEAA